VLGRGRRGEASDDRVYRITGARTPLSEDQRSRQRKYLFSMGLRTVCFLGAIVVSGPLRWVLVVGAVFLPYIAVVIANAGREPDRDRPPTAVQVNPRRGLGPGKPGTRPLG
jgi:hypothetical protein